MPLSATHDALPLPLTAFESLMLTIDRPDYPNCFLIRSKFTGRIQQSHFEDALDQALERNPLLCSIVQRRWRSDRWVWSPRLRPSIHWIEMTDPLELRHGEFVDLRQKVGIRIWVRRSETESEIIYQIHHACCDGIGFGQFIIDVALAYAQRTGENRGELELPEVDVSRLASRCEQAAGFPDLRSVYRLGRILENLVTRVHPHSSKTSADDFPNIRSHTFDKRTTRKLREYVRNKRGSMNDLLIRDMMLSIQAWNAEAETERQLPMRVLMPTSMRDADDDRTPAANLVGFTFVTQEVEGVCPEVLFQRIQVATKNILRRREDQAFLNAVVALKKMRLLWGVRRLVFRPCSTFVLSYLGNLLNRISTRVERIDGKLVMGDVVLEELMCVPPLRPNTFVASTNFMQAGRLTICLRCDPRQFSEEDSRALMNLFVSHIEESASTHPSFPIDATVRSGESASIYNGVTGR